MNYYLGVDLGGTNLVVGLISENGEVVGKINKPTRVAGGADAICDDIAFLCEEVLKTTGMDQSEVQGIGVGSPGIIQKGVVTYASNLNFDDVPLADMLGRRIDLPINLENDANAAAYGETLAGVGKGYDSVVALTIGTGIGGGIVLNKKILSGFNGAGGELGHVVVHANGRMCSCGKKGCLEAYCSATAIKELTQEAMVANPDSLMWELEQGSLEHVSAKTAFDAMKRGDLAGKEVVDNFIFYLSLGVSSTINLLQPEIFCIGGGVSREGDVIILPLRDFVREQTYLKKEEDRTQIVTAVLGSDAGLIGAALSFLQPRSLL